MPLVVVHVTRVRVYDMINIINRYHMRKKNWNRRYDLLPLLFSNCMWCYLMFVCCCCRFIEKLFVTRCGLCICMHISDHLFLCVCFSSIESGGERKISHSWRALRLFDISLNGISRFDIFRTHLPPHIRIDRCICEMCRLNFDGSPNGQFTIHLQFSRCSLPLCSPVHFEFGPKIPLP